MPRIAVVPDSSALPPALPALFACSQVSGDPDTICVQASGELDIASALGLEMKLLDAISDAGLVVLDLGDLEFIDTAGVRAIVKAGIHARQLAHRMVILRGAANVERMLALAGVGENKTATTLMTGPATTAAIAPETIMSVWVDAFNARYRDGLVEYLHCDTDDRPAPPPRRSDLPRPRASFHQPEATGC
jgi:anti-sigma B factor antagonist